MTFYRHIIELMKALYHIFCNFYPTYYCIRLFYITNKYVFVFYHCYYKDPGHWLRAGTPWYLPVSHMRYHNHHGLYATGLFMLPLLSIKPTYIYSDCPHPWLNGKITQGGCPWHYSPGSGLGLLLSKWRAKIWTNWYMI